jgi:hypothetical protein
VVRSRGWRATLPERPARHRAVCSRRGSGFATKGLVACPRRAIFGRDVDVGRRGDQRDRIFQLVEKQARRCRSMLASPLIDRPNVIVGFRSGSDVQVHPLRAKLVDNRGRRTELAPLRGRPRSRERLVQGLTFVLGEIVPFVVDHQVKFGALGQLRWLVEAQPPILDTCTQRRHVTTVWCRTAYRQADNEPSRTARRIWFDEAVGDGKGGRRRCPSRSLARRRCRREFLRFLTSNTRRPPC